MNPGIERLYSFWREQADTFVTDLTRDFMAHAGPDYTAIPFEEMAESFRLTVESWLVSLEADDLAAILNYTRRIGMHRARNRVDVNEAMSVIDWLRTHLWRLMGKLYAAGDWDMDVVEQIEHWLHEQRKGLVSSYNTVWHEAQNRLMEREQALVAQGRLIEQLSVPIVPIHEGVLVLPLVGAVDPSRATQIMEAVLGKIVEYQADVLLLDITGVPVVDTGVANYILQMARAVTLLGSQVVLVGIGAEIAQTIVQLGVELRNITTLANLQAGIAYALARQGYAISPISRG